MALSWIYDRHVSRDRVAHDERLHASFKDFRVCMLGVHAAAEQLVGPACARGLLPHYTWGSLFDFTMEDITFTLRANPTGDACCSGGARAHVLELDQGRWSVRLIQPNPPDVKIDPDVSSTDTECADSTAWSAWRITTGWDESGKPDGTYRRGWLHSYAIWSPAIKEADRDILEVGEGRYPTPREAREAAPQRSFEMVRPELVLFYLPTGGDSDNRGGLTFVVSPAP